MLNVFAMKSAIKERNHSKYRHQMVFHITVPSNILTDMTRMPLGTLGIKFCDSKTFIRWNRLNRLMSHKLKYTNQTILYVLILISRDSLLNEESTYIYIYIYILTTYLLHRYCPGRFLTMGLKARLNCPVTSALLSVSNSVFSTIYFETTPLLHVALSSKC